MLLTARTLRSTSSLPPNMLTCDGAQIRGQLFFIKLAHYEGEFSVGLGDRTFNASVDDEANG
eukprot:4100699-Pleurochrysis_carterae.AAC.1